MSVHGQPGLIINERKKITAQSLSWNSKENIGISHAISTKYVISNSAFSVCKAKLGATNYRGTRVLPISSQYVVDSTRSGGYDQLARPALFRHTHQTIYSYALLLSVS